MSVALLLSVAPGLTAADQQPAAPLEPALTLPAGSLVIVGGGTLPDSIRDRFLELAGGAKARLVVIPTASGLADRPGYVSPSFRLWRGQNVASVESLHTLDRERANDPSFVKPLTTATGVWLTGGDQSRLARAYRNTAVERELKRLLERGGVIGGTSAGASIMSALMITGGTTRATLGTGLGFLPGMVIDQHFTNRGRLGRLVGILAKHPNQVGMGIDEQTAVVLKGRTFDVLGNASVSLCLMPANALEPQVQRLQKGDQVDLLSLRETLLARSKPSGPTAAAEGRRTPETPPPGVTGKGRQ